MSDLSQIIAGYPWGVRVHVGEEGQTFQTDDGEIVLTKGAGVAGNGQMWLVQEDYDALKAATSRLSALSPETDR